MKRQDRAAWSEISTQIKVGKYYDDDDDDNDDEKSSTSYTRIVCE